VDIKETLTHKYGPLPGWAWAGVAAGGAYLYIRHRNSTATTSADTSGNTTTGAEESPGGGDFAIPYTGAGGLATELANADARDQRESERLDAERKRLKTYRTNHPAGRVNKRTRVYTAGQATTLQHLAARFGVTLAALRKANPNIKGSAVHKGERVHVPT